MIRFSTIFYDEVVDLEYIVRITIEHVIEFNLLSSELPTSDPVDREGLVPVLL